MVYESLTSRASSRPRFFLGKVVVAQFDPASLDAPCSSFETVVGCNWYASATRTVMSFQLPTAVAHKPLPKEIFGDLGR